MALTAAQLAWLRAKSGDNCTPYVVSDVLLQTYYDTAGTLECTVVAVLEDRWAKAKADASQLSNLGTSVDTANIDHIADLMDYWGGVCGHGATGSGIAQAETVPYRLDSEQTAAPDYSDGV